MALYGIYGSHTVEACPVNNRESARRLVSFAERDLAPLLNEFHIHSILGQYHSAFEHTFLWVVDAENPHLIEKFALEAGLAFSNSLTIVPIKTFREGIIPQIKEIHGI